MRVGVTYPTYVSALNEGVSKNVHYLFRALADAGEDVRFHSPHIDVSELNSKSVYVKRGWEAHKLALAVLRDPSYDLVHYHASVPSTAAFALLARWRARKATSPLLGHFWNPFATREDLRALRGDRYRFFHAVFNSALAAKPALWAFDALIVSSEYQRRQLFAAGFAGTVHVIPNGVDVKAYRPPATPDERAQDQAALGISGDPVIGFYGHATPMKGTIHFVDALPDVFEACPRASAVIAQTSYGHEAERVRARAKSLGVEDRIQFLGTCEVPRLLRAIDVGVVPQTCNIGTACHPNVLLEYLAAGVPVVASRVGSIPEVVQEGVTGRLVAPMLPQELSRAIVELAQDAQLRRDMARASRKVAQDRFSWAVVARLVRDAYAQSCLVSRRSGFGTRPTATGA